MLDLNLLSFVEPIGFGQIVDRESLVALPLGSIKLDIANGKDDIIVKVIRYKGTSPNEPTKGIPMKAYVWQDGVVVSGEETCSGTKEDRQKCGNNNYKSYQQFRFRKHPDNCHYEDIVQGVLQICVYNFTSTKLQPRKKIFVGTVHIALKCFRCRDREISADWYKVFPKSTMLPGSPSEIARDNCYINGEKLIDEQSTKNQTNEIPKRRSSIVNSNSESTITFDVFKVKRKARRKSLRRWFSFSASPAGKDIMEVENELQQTTFNVAKARTTKRESIYKWLKSQKSLTEISPCSSRLSEDSFSTTSSHPQITPPFIVATSSSGSYTASKRSSIISSQSMYSNGDSSLEESQMTSRNELKQARQVLKPGVFTKSKKRDSSSLRKSISF